MIKTAVKLEKSETALVLSRTFPASPERIYAAWTQPEQMNHWLHPSDQMRSVVTVDLRVGGSYRIEMHAPEGGPFVAVGTYREIVPNEKLMFTWRWENEDIEDTESLVTIALNPVGAETTEVVLTHEKFANTEERDNHAIGWEGTYAQLETYLIN